MTNEIMKQKKVTYIIIIFAIIIFDIIKIPIADIFSIKPFIFVCLVLFAWMVSKKIFIPINFRYFLFWYASLLIPLLFDTIISINQYVVIVVGQAILTGFLLCIYNFFIYFKIRLIDIFDSIIILGVVSSAIALTQIILFYAGFNIGVSHFETVGFPRALSLFSETDWYAMFTGYCLLAATLIPNHSKLFKYRNMLLAFFLISLIFSFGRTAIIAVCTSYISYKILFDSVKGILRSIVILLFISIPLSMFIIFIVPEMFINRFDILSNLSNSNMDSGALNSRLYSIYMTVDYIYQNPWKGNGAGSINFLSKSEEIKMFYADGGGINSGRGGTNIFLTTTFDSGFVGLIILVQLFIHIFKKNLYYIKISNNNFSYFLKFCFLENVFLLVECQANNMIRTPICWLNFSLLCYAMFVYRQQWLDCK